MTTDQQPRLRPRTGSFLWAGALMVALGLISMVLLPLLITSVALITVWVGIPMLAASLAVIRSVSMGYRRIAGRLLGGPVDPPYRPIASPRFADRLRGRIADPTTYRDLLWLPIAAVIGFPLGLIALIFYIIFPIGLIASPIMLRIFAALGAAVLRRADSETMERRIGELSKSRAETVDAQAAELRRIERDLHDGAQARLVSLSMNLGLAEKLMAQDPDASRDLIAESRQSATVALADLRHLVRGIHPPVLADRGLVGAIHALALAHSTPVEVDIELPGRPSPPVESALYFAVAEALANSAKHSAARSTWIWGRYTDDRIRISVGDDGVGGATVTPGGGMAGMEKRLAAFDGSVSVASPLAGGTIVSMELPCELSSERT